ncbi:MAG: glycosyltransferase family 2 protein [Bacteroidota bacterium]
MAETSIIIINYNGTDDTIRCLLSIHNCNSSDCNIIVVDNASNQNNRSRLKNWLEKKQGVTPENDSPVLKKQSENIFSPFEFQSLQFNKSRFNINNEGLKKLKSNLFFIETEINNGFAAGNNIGLQLAQILESKFVWLLNNDTEIAANALSELLQYSKKLKAENKKTGLVGSRVMFYEQPEIIQSLGGIFNPFFTKNSHCFGGKNESELKSEAVIKINYPYGASMFTDMEFISSIGFMQEDYFLLYEELDWTIRGKRKGFPVGVCLSSKVYHKQGKSMGRKMEKPHSPFTACLRYRNFLKLYRRFFPLLLPLAYFHLIYKWIGCIRNGKKEERKIIEKIFFGFSNCNIYKPAEMKN